MFSIKRFSRLTFTRSQQNLILFALALIFIAVASLGISALSSNVAKADVSALTFPNVKIETGSRIKVAGEKTLYPVTNDTFVAGETSPETYKSDEIDNALSTAVEDNYGTDEIRRSLSDPRLYNQDELYAWRGYMLGSTSPYWLSNTGSQGILSWQSYANANNSLNWDNELRAQGRDEDNDINYSSISGEKSLVVGGPYAWSKDAQLADYKPPEGSSFDYYSTSNMTLSGYSGDSYFDSYDVVYNNPDCEREGTNQRGFPNAYTTVDNILRRENQIAFGYIKDGKIVQVSPGQTLPSGTVMVVRFYQKTTVKYNILTQNDIIIERTLRNTDNFAAIAGASESNTSILPWNKYQYSEHWQTGFVVLKSDYRVGTSYKESVRIAGMGDYSLGIYVVSGDKVEAASNSIKPAYTYNADTIAFLRNANTSLSSFAVSHNLGNLPYSIARFAQNYKPVIKSEDTTLNLNFEQNNFDTNYGDRKQVILAADNTVRIPLGTATLSINNISANNANRISVLAGKTDADKYGIVGEVQNGTSNITIDVSSFINTSNVGNTAKLTLYAENINANGTSDAISNEGVTINIEVAALGDPQNITFNANGGTGTPPSAITNKRAGETLTIPDGTGLTKDGNPFSTWRVDYTLFGETTTTTDIVEVGSIYTVPDTNNGSISFTALYSGITTKKDTDTSATTVTITWDANGFGQTASARINGVVKYATQYDVGATATLPSEDLLTVPDGYYLDSYNTRADGTGDTVDAAYLASHALNSNVTYYAKWVKYVQITWRINPPDGTEGGAIGGKDSIVASYKVGDIISLPTETITNPTDWLFDSWNTASNGGGTTVDATYLAQNKASVDTVFYGKWRKGYAISWVAGDGAFADGSTTIVTTVMPGNAVTGPGVANPTRSGYSFGGWNSKVDGSGERIVISGSSATIPTSDSTYYALWVRDYWIAKAKSSNPITDVYKTTDQINIDVSKIKNNDQDTITDYKAIMEADEYHFYMKTGSGTSSNDYTEMRIVGVQQEAGSALTFMSVHSWGSYQMNSSESVSGGLPNMSLWNTLNNTLWNRIPSTLRARIVSVNKIYGIAKGSSSTSSRSMSIWLPAMSELEPVSHEPTAVRNEGPQFQLFTGKISGSVSDPNNTKYFGGIGGSRSDYLSYSGSVSTTRYTWLRSPMLNNSTMDAFNIIQESGRGGCSVGSGRLVTFSHAVAPCFCL